MVKFAQNRAHAVVTQSAGVARSRHKAAAESIHLCQRTDFAGIAVVVNITPAGQARTACRFYGDKAVIGFAAEFFAHKGGDQTAEVGAAAGASDDYIGLDIVFVKRSFGFHTDNTLMEHYQI